MDYYLRLSGYDRQGRVTNWLLLCSPNVRLLTTSYFDVTSGRAIESHYEDREFASHSVCIIAICDAFA